MTRWFVGILAVVTPLAAVPADEAKPEPRTAIRARYAKQSAAVLKIDEPVKVSKFDFGLFRVAYAAGATACSRASRRRGGIFAKALLCAGVQKPNGPTANAARP